MTDTTKVTAAAHAAEQEADFWRRPSPKQPWVAVIIGALVATIALTAGWEIYWRSQGWQAGDFKDNKPLWAQERRKAKGDALVLIGDSRMLFDIDLNVWQEMKGVRPVQLAMPGTSARITLTDLANDPDFHGTVFAHVLGPMTLGQVGGVGEASVPYAKKQTLSEMWDYELSKVMEHSLAFVDEYTRPKQLMFYADLPLRAGQMPRAFPWKLSVSDPDRNTRMWRRVETDEDVKARAKKVWIAMFGGPPPPPKPGDPAPPPGWRPTPTVKPAKPVEGMPMERLPPVQFPSFVVDASIASMKADIDKIRARGGDVVFARFPYDGFFEFEDVLLPTSGGWDRILKETASTGVSFKDHPQMQGFHVAEYSHLASGETERFTRAVVPLFYEALAEGHASRGGK